MGVMLTDPLVEERLLVRLHEFSCRKVLISDAFLFVVAVEGMNPFVQRYLQGVWTILLYSFFLFIMGSIFGAANHGLDVTVVVCTA